MQTWRRCIATSASALGTAFDPPVDDFDSGTFSSSSSAAGNGAGGTADASVSLGVIKLYASSFAAAGNHLGTAHAEGVYSEDLTISSAGLNGTQARVTMGVTLQGMIDPTGGGYSWWTSRSAGAVSSAVGAPIPTRHFRAGFQSTT